MEVRFMRTLSFLIALASTTFVTVSTASAQYQPEPNPANKPYVFLGGDKVKKGAPATSRAVKGVVTDEFGKPTQGALVTLTDLKSKEKWTVVTKVDGKYDFDELSFVVDYELLAKRGSSVSVVKKLSQYEHAPLVVRNLVLFANAAAAEASIAPASPSTSTPSAAPAPTSTSTPPKN
jgi:hypothetical protein